MTVSTELITPVIDYVNTLPRLLIDKDCVINVYIKTPNMFYRTIRVYLKIDNHEPYEVTDKLKDSVFNLTRVRDMMAVIYHDYFARYNEPFKDPYYQITLGKIEGKWQKPLVAGSPSPDPLDVNGTQIKRNL